MHFKLFRRDNFNIFKFDKHKKNYFTLKQIIGTYTSMCNKLHQY